jgi:four helix bundle protein
VQPKGDANSGVAEFRAAMGEFGKLHVWRKAHALALNVYRVSTKVRGSAHASLRSQLIRSAMSIPANIVEGRGQKSDKDFCRFLGYALHSSSELEYHLIIARDIRVIAPSEFRSLFDQLIEVRKMLYGLIRSISKPEAHHESAKN